MKLTVTTTLILALMTSSLALAEVPLLSTNEIKNKATHIIIGKVRTVYRTIEKSDQWERTDLIAEIAVISVEKGEELAANDVVYAHYWNKKWIGKNEVPPHASGHSGVNKGDFVRAHLKLKEGAYHVLLPNGFDKLKADEAEKATIDITANLQGTWNFVYYEEKGKVEQPGTKQFVISDNHLEFRAGGQTRVETTIDVKARTMDQNFKDGQVYRSIFTRVGDLLIICGNRDKNRPTEFAGGTDNGGEFFIVLKRN